MCYKSQEFGGKNIRTIIFILFLVFVYYLVKTFLTPSKREGKKKVIIKDGVEVDDIMVKDPACGIYLPESDAIKAKVKGEVHYFCSEECIEKFKRGIRYESPGDRG